MDKKLTKEERVLRVIRRQEVDYLPSQVILADRSRHAEISAALGLASEAELDGYLENHLYLTLALEDKPLFYRDVQEEIDALAQRGFCKPDWPGKVVYDAWGMGIRVGVGSFFTAFHPLEGKAAERHTAFMPAHVSHEALFAKDLKDRILHYRAPDPDQPGNTSDWEKDLREKSGDFLVWPSGYLGIYERACFLTGWETFMTLMAEDRRLMEDLLDKVTDHRVQMAKKVVQMGFRLGHSGDDLGTQRGGIFSERDFREVILPRLKRYWQVFTDAGLPIMFHSCGDITRYLPHLIDIGLTILEPCQPVMDLAHLKREYGKDLIFFGGINTQVLPFITPEQTREMARTTIRTLGRGGGYIIAPSQEIMNDVPIANIKALVETIREERERVLDEPA
jgi:uroporphyrinogen decarboxylase